MQQVLKLSQYYLLQTASVDTLARFQGSVLCVKQPEIAKRVLKVYFEEQEHFSFVKFLQSQISVYEENKPKQLDYYNGGALLQVCFHDNYSVLLVIVCLYRSLPMVYS